MKDQIKFKITKATKGKGYYFKTFYGDYGTGIDAVKKNELFPLWKQLNKIFEVKLGKEVFSFYRWADSRNTIPKKYKEAIEWFIKSLGEFDKPEPKKIPIKSGLKKGKKQNTRDNKIHKTGWNQGYAKGRKKMAEELKAKLLHLKANLPLSVSRPEYARDRIQEMMDWIDWLEDKK